MNSSMNVAIMAQAVMHVHDCGDLCRLEVAVRLCLFHFALYFCRATIF